MSTGLAPSVPVVDRITFVSWNMHVGGGDVGELVRVLRQGGLTRGTPVQHFVLLLQEVFRHGPEVPDARPASFDLPSRIGDRSRAATSIGDLAKELELNWLYAPSMRNGGGREDRGNAIVSSLPLDNPLVMELPFERQRRAAVSATLRLRTSGGAEFPLRVVSIHLDTALAFRRGGPAKARARQARALLAALEPGAMIVVGGDLNTWWGDDEPAVKAMREALPDANALPARAMTWSGLFGVATRVDYLFARLGRRIDVERVHERFGSDHHPVIATFDAIGEGGKR